MSIRFLTKDYYVALQKVEKLEAELAAAPYDKRTGIEEELRIARAEKIQLRRMLDGAIDNARND